MDPVNIGNGGRTDLPEIDESQGAPRIANLPVRALSARITTALFGYDAFLSYSRADGTQYAERLAKLLSPRNCFLDREENQAGDELTHTLKRALHRSRVLIVVLSEAAVGRKWVRDEWDEFGQTGRPAIVISVNGAHERATWAASRDPIRIEEDSAALSAGNPSKHVVDDILRSFTFTRRATLARRILSAGVLTIAVAASLAVWFGFAARKQARLEARQRRVAERVFTLSAT